MTAVVNPTLLIVFACIVLWTIVFSCFNSPKVRSGRNIGFLAAYVVGIASAFFIGLVPAVVSWLFMGLIGGVLYFLREIAAYFSGGRKSGDPFPSPISLIHGLLLWPVMIPEAFEYAAAELGVLKAEELKDPKAK